MKKEKLKTKRNVGANVSVRPNSRGITLIALIITIIVMLILVGVSVTVALNGGLFSSAQDAKTQTQEERDKELALSGGQIEINGEVYDSLEDYLDTDKNQIINGEVVKKGDLVYVVNKDTKTATVYGNKENIDYENWSSLTLLFLMTNNPQVTATEINILSEVKIDGETYIVDSIASSAFCGISGTGATSIKSVTIPDSVTSIGSGAFRNCTSLENITIPDSVTSLGTGAFAGTPWGANNSINGLFIRDNVLIDGSGATGDVTIPNGVVSIADNAFIANISMTSVTIPDSVTSIGAGAFQGCTSLTSITVPGSVTSIGISAFMGTPWFEEQKTNATNGLVIINSILIDASGATGDVVIPSNVVNIADNVFANNTSITSVTIPNSVIRVGNLSFMPGPNLQTINVYWEEGNKPEGWDENWNGSTATVVYGYTGE